MTQPPDVGMIPVEQAAAELGIRAAKLRGHILRNHVTDPIGDLHWVYADTLGPLRLRQRLANSADAARCPVCGSPVWPGVACGRCSVSTNDAPSS